MIGSMVEYTGAFEDFHGRRGIVIAVNTSVMFKKSALLQNCVDAACQLWWSLRK